MVSVHGQLTTGSHVQGELGDDIRRLLNIGFKRFVLDLEHLERFDSLGAAEVAGACERVVESGGEIEVMRAPPRIRELLNITQLHKLF